MIKGLYFWENDTDLAMLKDRAKAGEIVYSVFDNKVYSIEYDELAEQYLKVSINEAALKPFVCVQPSETDSTDNSPTEPVSHETEAFNDTKEPIEINDDRSTDNFTVYRPKATNDDSIANKLNEIEARLLKVEDVLSKPFLQKSI